MKRSIVLVVWQDSVGVTSQWEGIDEIESMLPHLCYCVGFLLEKKKDIITITLGLSETQVIGRMTIPRISIESIEVIKTLDIFSAKGKLNA